jgi:hypothetical protein
MSGVMDWSTHNKQFTGFRDARPSATDLSPRFENARSGYSE